MLATAVLCLLSMCRHPLSAQTAKLDPPDELYSRIKPIIGADALECGRSQVPGDGKTPGYTVEAIEPSLTCAKRSAGAKRAFWTFLRSVHPTNWVAAGLYAKSDGVIQYFTYTNDPKGTPVLDVKPCGEPSLRTDAAGVVWFSCSLVPQ